MKNTLALVSITAVAATLTACSVPVASPAPTVTVTASQTAPAPAPSSEAPQAGANDPDTFSSNDDDMFLTLLRSQDSSFDYVNDSTLIELGHTICGAIDGGMTLDQYALVATQNDVTAEQAATLLAASVVALCPWNESTVRSWM